MAGPKTEGRSGGHRGGLRGSGSSVDPSRSAWQFPPGDAALGNDPLTSGLATIRPGCAGRERHIYVLVLSVAQAVPALDCLEG